MFLTLIGVSFHGAATDSNSVDVDGSASITESASIGGPEDVYLSSEMSGVFAFGSTIIPLDFSAVSEEKKQLASKERVIYTVQPGDTPSEIAQKFGIRTSTVLWANQLKLSSIIRPGDDLTILPVDGLVHKVKDGDTVAALAGKYRAEVREIIKFNDLPPDGFIKTGQELIIPGGIMPPPPRQRSRRTSRSLGRAVPVSSGYFTRPVAGVLSQGLHPFNAVDIAAPCGRPVIAAADGVVTIARTSGWNGGYGLYVRIGHKNGTSTTYAHMSKVFVSPGQEVAKGETIGAVGSTGRSTGCHTHFGVRGAQNPFAR